MFVITTTSNRNKTLYLAYSSVTGKYWTENAQEARTFKTLYSALTRLRTLQFNNPKVQLWP